MITVEPSTEIEAPLPVLFNTWKHHAGVLRLRIRDAVAVGATSLDDLSRQLVVMGTELMDLYTGPLSPGQIGTEVIDHLQLHGRLKFADFREWLATSGGYAMAPLSDGSEWVLRAGDEAGAYVHIHPGRWVPHTCRVRANVLKTAVLALAYSRIHGGDPLDLTIVNAVRRQYLTLAPLGRDLSGDQGIGSMIDRLR